MLIIFSEQKPKTKTGTAKHMRRRFHGGFLTSALCLMWISNFQLCMPFLKRAFTCFLSFCVGLIRLEDIRSFSCRQCFRGFYLLLRTHGWTSLLPSTNLQTRTTDFVITFDEPSVIIKVCVGSRLRIHR